MWLANYITERIEEYLNEVPGKEIIFHKRYIRQEHVEIPFE